MSGLILVSTPIGNLGDLSERAREAFKGASHILCEDTRNTKNLFSLIGLSLEGKNFSSFHDHSKEQELQYILKNLKAGQTYLLVSDAGSPMVSDPAFPLVKAAIDEGINIDSIPGASAPIMALELSGLVTSPFTFHGFLGRDKKDRQKFFERISLLEGTHIFFEGASRVEECMEELCAFFPEEKVVLTRELTKKFQAVHRMLGKEWKEKKEQITFKGEFVILVEVKGRSKEDFSSTEVKRLAQEILEQGNRPKAVAKLLSSILGLPTKEVYESLSGKSE